MRIDEGLTVCVVTKGRSEFLGLLLQNLDLLIAIPGVEVLIIDNGSQPHIQDALKEWVTKGGGKAHLIRYHENRESAVPYFSDIKEVSLDWIMFPGDDDLVNVSIIEEWRDEIKRNSELVAYAFSAQEIDEFGNKTGNTLHPSILPFKTRTSQLNLALNEPPFIWPATIFKSNILHSSLPTSRMALDWYVGIELILTGEVIATKKIGLRYRRHRMQESSIVSMQRKVFEDAFWLYDLIQSSKFSDLLSAFSTRERQEFAELLSKRKPVYGDLLYGGVLSFPIWRGLIHSESDYMASNKLVCRFAETHGVFFKEGDVGSFLDSKLYDLARNTPGNIQISIVDGTCLTVQYAARHLQGIEGSVRFTLSCSHSKESGQIFIDCNSLPRAESRSLADLVLIQLFSYLEREGINRLILTSGESRLLQIIRSLKRRVPKKLVRVLTQTLKK